MNESMFSRRPAARLVILLISGILMGQVSELGSVPAFLVASGIFLSAIALLMWKTNSQMAALSLHASVIALGFTLHQYHRERAHSKIVEPVELGESVIILGVVDGGLISQGDFHRFMVKSSFLSRGTGIQKVERRFLVLARKSVTTPVSDSLELGTLIVFDGVLQRMPRPRNPGEFDYGRYLELNDIHGVVEIERTGVLQIVAAGTLSFEKVVARMQKVLHRIIDRFHKQDQASFLKGVALGHREDISVDMKQSFIDTGTIHILAVSGSNVAVVALIFYSIFGFFRISKRFVTVGTIVGLLLYMVITGMSPSVMRATIMAIVILVGMSIERKTDIYNSVSAAGAMLLLWDTNYLFDVGFQLSFAAVLSIVYFYPILNRLITRIPDWLEEVKGVDYVLKLCAVSLAAQLGTLPFTAYYFGRISLVSLLANLVVVPISGINTILGFAMIAFSFLSEFVAQCYASLNSVLVDFLLGFVRASAAVPFAYFETSDVSLAAAAFYFTVVGAAFNVSNKFILKRLTIFSFIMANVFIFQKVFADQTGRLRVTMLDVGQGDALVVEFPNRKTLLVDAGPKSWRYDAGERVITPFLKRNGVRQLDAILISHPHADHFGGISSVLEHFRVDRILEAVSSQDSGLYDRWKKTAGQLSIPTARCEQGDRVSFDPSVRMYILHPHLPEDSSSDYNNASLVLKVVYGSTSIFFTGDAELETETKLVRKFGGFLSSQVVKAGHHGSATSSGREFLEYISPYTALVSVGINNKFGHPSDEVIARFQSFGAEVLRTDEDGAIILESDGTRWKKVEWRR